MFKTVAMFIYFVLWIWYIIHSFLNDRNEVIAVVVFGAVLFAALFGKREYGPYSNDSGDGGGD